MTTDTNADDMNPSPMIDLVFRYVFAREEEKGPLISLLNGVLEKSGLKVVDVAIRNAFNLATYDGDKETIVDVKAEDQAGIVYYIEMQLRGHADYPRRALVYGARLVVDQMHEGDDYSAVSPVIGMNFLGFNRYKDDRMTRCFVFKDTETNAQDADLSKYLQLYFIEVPKLRPDWQENGTLLDLWVAFLANGPRLHPDALPEALKREPELAKAVSIIERMRRDPVLRERYEAEVKRQMVAAAELKYAHQEGRQEGRQEGQLVGRAEGARATILRQGTKRFGDPPAWVRERLESIVSFDRLEELADRVLDANSWDDLLPRDSR